ncbi:PD-(D/E)XK motif protein [Rathayibacter caricis]|uniref:PD-(D/E)XK motif protein n=1 Tax=Rathayibacter caricis TaxID=110936 RepID=UPI001FB36968|nr:PD-(D/E)XK motif protein [Rathayibacter caricis]MCJ1696096.1 PD-(D/E)XK motif protein [Rathayibacter caricis]
MNDEELRPLFTPETLERYFRSTAPTVHPLSDAPVCLLLIEPDSRRLRLRTPATDSPADVGAYDRLGFGIVEEPGEETLWFELTIDADGMAYEGYSLIVSVVDQLEAGRPFRHSVSDALAAYRELLTRQRTLSDEQEIGLFGELGVFAHLVETTGEEAATAAWLGPDSEEHDFVLDGCDLEIKTTRAETRVHVIGSATQLLPSPDRPLHLVSIQLTAAGAAAGGETLPERVRRVRGLLTRGTRVFEERLRSLGWYDLNADEVYTRGYVLRSTPRSYPVGEDFPAIVPDGLARIVRRPELVVGLAYRIDVTGLPVGSPPAELAGFCERSAADGS